MGHISTFYSFKGGVGRSMALANIGVLLARWGYRTLLVDWDLEAPGLEFYFKDYLQLESVRAGQGVVDILHAQSSGDDSVPDWRRLITHVTGPDQGWALSLLTAGAISGEAQSAYFEKVRGFDVGAFYANRNGGRFIETLRNEWRNTYDFTLVDSRTGVTDFGGICTIQLPDLLVTCFTATDQGFEGTVNVVSRAARARQELPVDRLKLLVLPVPSRFDTDKEFVIAQEWMGRFADRLRPVYADWLPRDIEPRTFLEATKVPYIPYFSFGEQLAVLKQGVVDPTGLGYAYETIAALLATNLEHADKLTTNRAELIRLAGARNGTILTSVAPSHEFLDIDRARVDAHADWLRSGGRSGRRLDVTNGIASKVALPRADLRQAVFSGADISASDFTAADLTRAVFNGANLTRARLPAAKMSYASGVGSTLVEADLRNAEAHGIDLTGADLRNARMMNADLSDAKLVGASFVDADMRRCTLNRALMAKANFSGTRLEGAAFKSADLREVTGLTAAQMRRTDLAGASLPPTVTAFDELADINGKTLDLRIKNVCLIAACVAAIAAELYVYEGAADSLAQFRQSLPSLPYPSEMAASPFRTALLVAMPFVILFAAVTYWLKLQSVWADAAILPAVFPDSKTLDRKLQFAPVRNIVWLWSQRGPRAFQPGILAGAISAIEMWLMGPLAIGVLAVLRFYVAPGQALYVATGGFYRYLLLGTPVLGLLVLALGLWFAHHARRQLRAELPELDVPVKTGNK